MESLNGIKIGDWVTSCYKGYWLVVDIKPAYLFRKMTNMLFVIKKGFTPTMKFSVKLDSCAPDWCKKVSDGKLKEILEYFESHPKEKEEFETYDKPIIGECMAWRIDLSDEKVSEYNILLKELPENFTINQFNRFVEKIGLRRYMKGLASPGKYKLWIKSYPWMVDKDNNKIYFEPEIIFK